MGAAWGSHLRHAAGRKAELCRCIPVWHRPSQALRVNGWRTSRDCKREKSASHSPSRLGRDDARPGCNGTAPPFFQRRAEDGCPTQRPYLNAARAVIQLRMEIFSKTKRE